MTISFPIALPTVGGLMRITIADRVVVGMSESPSSLSQQTYEHRGDGWAATLEFTEMDRAEAEEWIAWRQSLRGRLGTLLLGDPVNTTPRGTWSGSSPVVSGAHAAGVQTLTIRDVDGKTWKRGDWFQLGSGSGAYLHKVVADGSQAGSPSTGQIEIFPRTRAALADADALTLASPQGRFRLGANAGSWMLDPDSGYILPPLNLIEAL